MIPKRLLKARLRNHDPVGTIAAAGMRLAAARCSRIEEVAQYAATMMKEGLKSQSAAYTAILRMAGMKERISRREVAKRAAEIFRENH
jgi:hypothetical protein